jgi:hypothetical protein
MIYAVKDIKKGEEASTIYIISKNPYKERKSKL